MVQIIIIESTYGNRLHETKKETINLADIIMDTAKRGGNVIIPSFAVGRSQEILYILNHFIDVEKKRALRNIEVYLDSPLAQEATQVFGKHLECYDDEALKDLTIDGDPLDFKNLFFTASQEESMMLNEKKGIVIISSSGMCEAGRIKHHLKYNLWNKNSSIVFVGYQAEGTLGRKILEGAKIVKIFGEEIHVAASIYNIPGLSGHADMIGLLDWVRNIKNGVSQKIFITHGDPEASITLRKEITDITSTKCEIPKLYDEYIL
jgi:metallo-beta-lactamase family protein